MTMADQQIKTQWIQPKAKRAKPVKLVRVDVAELQVTDDKPVVTRVKQGNKYQALFESMKPGQCIKCRPEEVQSVSQSMRKWILENRDITKLKVKAVMNYPDDGLGRVWMMQKGGAA